MKNKSIIIMTILSLVLVVGCCYHQQYMMNCNYDMPVSECPAMVTNTKQDEVDDKKDTQSVTTKDCMYYCIRNSIYKVDVNTKEKYLVYKNDKLYWYYDIQVEDDWQQRRWRVLMEMIRIFSGFELMDRMPNF